MEAASWAVIAIVAVTLIVMTGRRYNATMVLAMSNIVIFAVIEIAYRGTFNVTLLELGLKFSMVTQEPWTLITSMFIHADFFHLIFNMLFLIAIGIPLESRIGKRRFLTVYIAGGIIGSLVFAFAEWGTSLSVVLVGASGAISALMGAMIMLYPREKIMFFLGPLLTNRFSVYVPILVWFGLQFFLFMFDSSPVAYAAHIGGFAGGAVIAWVIRPSNPASPRKGRMRDISPLKELCTTSALREMYGYAESASDDETRTIWTERILRDVKCPLCGSPIRMRRNGFKCREGHEQ
ncbi:MAG: rhomboid family intramembrane serine protease [Methanomassiliicoccaceae archaeon]|nr:rhomboid family intramembrane serine protease [Methanomassiliicoccaceae archaeon]